jgi:hypothetical protein
MGFLLSSRYDFSKVGEIRMAYSQAFSKDSAKIDAILSRKSIDALNVTRNLIAHCAGKANDIYVARIKDIPSAVRLAKGEQLMVDGEICQGARRIDPPASAEI